MGVCIPIFIMRHWQLANHIVFNQICEDNICDSKQFFWDDKYLLSKFYKIIATPQYLCYLNFAESLDMKLNILTETSDTSNHMTVTAALKDI